MRDDPLWQRYWRYLSARFRPEVDDELDFHVEMRAKELERQGFTPDQARREAVRRFGDRRRIRATLHRIEEKRGRRMTLAFRLQELWQDVRYGVRGLLKRPGFTVMTVSSLGLGIAAATVVLSLIDAFLLRPLPVRHADRLVVVGSSNRALGQMAAQLLSPPTVRDLADRTDLFEDAAGVTILAGAIRVPGAESGERAIFLAATGTYFSVLGVPAARGRMFTLADDRDRARVLVLTDKAWRTRFGADPGIVGRTVLVNTLPFEVIGVTPPGFHGTEHLFQVSGFVPAGVVPSLENTPVEVAERIDAGRYSLIARRVAHRSIGDIRAALTLMSARLESEYPEIGDGFRLVAYPESRARPALAAANGTVMAGVVFAVLALLVLLTAAVNATNLILSRATTRQQELAVRQALGASRGRLVMQLLTETLILALLALAAGWGLAALAIGGLRSIPLSFGGMTMSWGLGLDHRVFLMAVAVTLCTGVVAGIGPALSASAFALQARIREGGRAGTGGRGRRIRSGLVVVQVAASVVVLVSAGLFVVSAKQVEKVDLGIRSDHLLSLGLDASLARYDRASATEAMVRIERAVAAVPGVQSVAWSTAVPIKKGASDMFEVQSEVAGQTSRDGTVTLFGGTVGPSYFETMGIPILEGRAFTEADDSTRKGVVILNQLAAERLFPGQPALGRTVRLSGSDRPLEVVGVARNGLYMIIAEAPRAYAYVPMAQRYQPAVYLTVRTTTEPNDLIPAVRKAIQAADRQLVPFDVQSVDEMLETSPNGMLVFRVVATFASVIGMVAVVLTLVGLYGVISYSVSQRTQEIGLRMALGASHQTVVRSIVADGARLAGIGIGLGLVAAILLTRVLANLLVGARSLDGVILALVAVGLGAAALVSAYLPARRAARIDPVAAIRST